MFQPRFLSKFCPLVDSARRGAAEGYNTAIMSPQSREKVALAVFAALIVLSLCGLGWYLFAGHSWNVAASNIDDTFGSMDGYTAIIYAGTVEVEEDAADGKAVGGLAGGAAGSAADSAAESADAPAGSAGSAGEAPDAADGSALADSEAPAGGSLAADDEGESPLLAGDADADAPGEKSAALEKAASGATASTAAKKQPLSATEVCESYEDKGATVFELDTEAPGRYAEGTILKKGGHRFGVFSVERPLSKRLIEKQIAYFADHEVDFIVAVTSDRELLEGVEGIDIVVSTQDEELFVMGETIGATFYVAAPETGKVGAILISPSNVVSAKVIEEL